MKKSKTLPFVEGALVIAMSMVLSFIKVYQLPWGGSITLLSMLPVAMYSIKYGVKRGLLVSFLFSLLQFMQGCMTEGVLGWGLTPAMLTACIFLDYILAYTAVGFAGMFRNGDIFGWISGTAVALLMRFACHLTSGVVIFHSAGKLWEGFATDNTFVYSFLYNGSYMLPEILFTAVGAFVMFRVPAIKKLIIQPTQVNI